MHSVLLLCGCSDTNAHNLIACWWSGKLQGVQELQGVHVAVVEVSSYQLEVPGRFRADAAVLLNLTPDHLERHGSMEAYAEAKCSVFKHMKGDGTAIIPAGLYTLHALGFSTAILSAVVLFAQVFGRGTIVVKRLLSTSWYEMATSIFLRSRSVPVSRPTLVTTWDILLSFTRTIQHVLSPLHCFKCG